MKAMTLILVAAGLIICNLAELHAQIVYVDVLTAPAMRTYANTIKRQQEKTNENLSAIHKGQVLINSQLEVANNLQQKVVKGLTEVSKTVRNAVTIKRIYETSQDIILEVAETTRLAAENPQYVIFAEESASVFKTRALGLASEITHVLEGGETNMMDAGERQKLLNHIYDEIRLIYGAAFGMKHSIKWAVRRGFWNSLFPFSGWVNQDVRIMNEIISNAKTL
ncbi:MAG: hypothetical protein PHI28_18015 [Mangrovibacterium sp.]|nr:hypothetical protein [Mangrovibacterium sp.]